LHKPPWPISFGTHHSKAMFLVYPRGVRIIVHTAKIYVDWNNKSQGLWMQDFPWTEQNSLSKGSGFENDLVEYLSALKVQIYAVLLYFKILSNGLHYHQITVKIESKEISIIQNFRLNMKVYIIRRSNSQTTCPRFSICSCSICNTRRVICKLLYG
jgi:tyrosyl-DNA phosphodiesterase-1